MRSITFKEWWDGYSKPEYFNEPLDTLRHSDHDQSNFDELIKGVAEKAWDASRGVKKPYRNV